jgi:FemAB-related protein (PEP-CTERM system-associated)
MNVSVLDSPDVHCDNFVRRIPGAKLCHFPAWAKMVEKIFGHKSLFLVAREDGDIYGVLPLTQVRSRLFGNRMISQAFSNYGGLLVTSPKARDALYDRAVQLALDHECESMELRNIEALPYDMQQNTNKITVLLPLVSSRDEVWKRIGHKIRNRIRKAEKSGIVVLNGGSEMVDDFYRVWTIRMGQLGTPCYPRKLFAGLIETFPENCRIFVAKQGNTVIGSMFTYFFNGVAQIRWGGVKVEYNRLAPTTYLFWSIAEHYCEKQTKYLDFGTSTEGSSQEEFKRRWRGQSIRLYYQYWLKPNRKLSITRPENPKFAKKVEIWKRLPLWMTRMIGPYISCNLP